MNISVVIPHFGAREKIYTCIEKNKSFFDDNEIIIVNDDPRISIIKEIQTIIPHAVVIEHAKNEGFAIAAHDGITAAHNPFVLLLNTDVFLKDRSYQNSLTQFETNPSLFALSFCQQEKNNKRVGKNMLFWKKGFIQHVHKPSNTSGITAWAEGGSMILDKVKYTQLGGFDSLFCPFYWEDVDLSYRAWKMGYSIYFDSSVLVEHHHESTISHYFNQNYIRSISYRNQFLTIWKNITDKGLVFEHVLYTLWQLFRLPFKSNPGFFTGLISALVRIPSVISFRYKHQKLWKKTDKELLSQLSL